jgi:predicted dehydrogenase
MGVVGCGYWGPNLIRNFSALSGCNLKRICDRDEERLRHLTDLHPGVEAVTEFQDMLNGSDLDAITIATPVRHHFPLAKASLEAGKHTFIEKPMASSSEECAELNEIAERNGLVLMVGHTFLYSSPVRHIKKIIDDGEIGAIQYISSRRLNLGLFQKDINVVWDLAPHDISIILYLMGDEPVSVNCQGSANVTPGVEDVAMLSMHFKGGGYASVQNSWLEPNKVREMTIVGTKRMIVYDDVEPLQKVKIYDMRVERPPHYDNFAEFQYSYHYGDMTVPRIQQKEPLRVECQHFIDCVDTGNRPLTCGERGRDLVEILEASTESLKVGGGQIPMHGGPLDADASQGLSIMQVSETLNTNPVRQAPESGREAQVGP